MSTYPLKLAAEQQGGERFHMHKSLSKKWRAEDFQGTPKSGTLAISREGPSGVQKSGGIALKHKETSVILSVLRTYLLLLEKSSSHSQTFKASSELT